MTLPTVTDLPIVKSAIVDYYIGVGVAIDQIMRVGLADPKREIRLQNGLIQVWVGDTMVQQYGIAHVELTVDNWADAAAGLAIA